MNPMHDAERAKFIALKIHLVECTPDQAKQLMQEKSFDGAVFAYHPGVNSEQNIVDLLLQTASLVRTGRLVAFGQTDDQANLDAKVKSAGGAGATSSLPNLLALLGLGT